MKSFLALAFIFSFPASSLAHSIIAAVPGLGSGVSRQSPGNNMRLLAQSSVQAEYSQAASLFKSGKFTEAISSFSLIISNPSTSVGLRNQSLIARSQAFLVINQPGLAIVDLKKVIYKPDQRNSIGNKEMILGVAYIQIKQYQLAVKHLTQAIRYLPNDASVYANRSVAYQALKNYDLAINDIQKALEIDPTPSSIYNLAVLEKERKNFSKCYYLLSQLKNQDAAYADVYLQRGLCSKALNQHQRALEDFLRASSIDNSKAEAIENAGLMLSLLGNNKVALQYLETASTLYLQQGNIQAFEAISSHISRITTP